jgi:hypothetical protein
MILVNMHLNGVNAALESTKGTFGFHDDGSLLWDALSTDLETDASCLQSSLLTLSSYMVRSADMIVASGLNWDI